MSLLTFFACALLLQTTSGQQQLKLASLTPHGERTDHDTGIQPHNVEAQHGAGHEKDLLTEVLQEMATMRSEIEKLRVDKLRLDGLLAAHIKQSHVDKMWAAEQIISLGKKHTELMWELRTTSNATAEVASPSSRVYPSASMFDVLAQRVYALEEECLEKNAHKRRRVQTAGDQLTSTTQTHAENAKIIKRSVRRLAVGSVAGASNGRGRRRLQGTGCDLATQTSEVMDSCCTSHDGGGGHRRAQANCPLPNVCPGVECAAVLVPFYSECIEELVGTPDLAAGLALLVASCEQLLASGPILAQQLNLECADAEVSAEECIPPCNRINHGLMLLMNIDGSDSKYSCNIAHGLYSWIGAASEGGYIGTDFASFFSAIVSGAAGAFFVTLTRDANIGTQLTIRPGQSASMTGDRMLVQPPLLRTSGITVQERGLLTLAYVELDGEIHLDPIGSASLTDVFCSSTFWSASPNGPRTGTAVGETDGTYTIEPPQLGLIGIFAGGFSVSSGPCTVSDDMKCVGRPDGYLGNERCTITVVGGGGVLGPCQVFDTRLANSNIHQDGDPVILPDGSEHRGSDCPVGAVLAPGDVVTWRSDPSSQGSGGRDGSRPTWRGNGCADKGLCGLPYSETGLGGGWQICTVPGVLGCTTPVASNYDPNANVDDGSCEFALGCTNPTASNYNPAATVDDSSCVGTQSEVGVRWETWEDIPGTAVRDLTASPEYIANAPTISGILGVTDYLEIPSDTNDNVGNRLTAFFLAPQTGSYTFVIASDDNGELWLGLNEATTERIASVPAWTSPREWDKFPEQMSAPQSLEAGSYYYIVALAKEGSGGDNLAVGVTLPDGQDLRPIPVRGYLFLSY